MSTSTAVDRCHEIKDDTEAAYMIDYLDSTEKSEHSIEISLAAVRA